MSQPSDDLRPEDFLEFLSRIDEPPPSDPDELSVRAEADSYDRLARKIKLEELTEGVRNRKQDREQRKTYAGLAFVLVCVWLAAVLSMLFLQGVGGNAVMMAPEFLHIGPFELSDSVLMVLIGSTTGSVVAIFVIVARHLFPRRDSH